MATQMPPEDISALMTSVNMDRSQYKVFEGRAGNQFKSSVPSRASVQGAPRTRSRSLYPANGSLEEVQEVVRPCWNVLNSLLSPKHKDNVESAQKSLLVPMVTFCGGSGGVGKTTVMSTLARILSGMGESPMLVFSDSQRTLPLYFGGQVGAGRVRTYVPPSRKSGELHLYARPLESSGAPEELDCWLPNQVNALASEVGRVLCEVTSSEMSERQAIRFGTINLRVVVPDISSVLSVNRDCAPMGSATDDGTFYLLNKYDPTVPFHRDVRARLSTMLGDRLLPFAIRRTDQVPEALAAGVTVVDYAPGSDVAQDFGLLAQWLRDSMPCNEINPKVPFLNDSFATEFQLNPALRR